MRITIVTAGSRGDVQPYVALALGFARAGHGVRVATHENFRAFVTARGLDFAPIGGDPQAILRGAAADAWLASGRNRNMLRFVREMGRVAPALVEEMLADFWRACQDADAVIFSVVALASWQVAERLRVPSAGAFLQPFTRTRDFPAIGLPPALRLGGAFNWATHLVAEQLLWQPVRRRVNAWRGATLGLSSLPVAGPLRTMARHRTPVLYGYSPSVVPRPADWPEWVHVTGYWFLDVEPGWRPPPALEAFLADGPPPVYVGFGSMTPRNAARLTGIALEALERAGQRGVLLKGWGSLGEGDLPAWAHAVADVPHAWLFPRTAAVVHHGGAGTTGAGLRAGVPSILTPLGFDQPFWGARVAALGVGPAPISRRSLTAEQLAAAITAAVGDEGMRERAARLGAQIRAEDGVGCAVDRFERYVRERGTAAA
jgi:UDP:flavonoid glycosyltransferase YjiC (YdhE family)